MAMMIDYAQGIALTLTNQDGESSLTMIARLLTEATHGQAYAEVVNSLGIHQK